MGLSRVGSSIIGPFSQIHKRFVGLEKEAVVQQVDVAVVGPSKPLAKQGLQVAAREPP
jgi:hypothetical protein